MHGTVGGRDAIGGTGQSSEFIHVGNELLVARTELQGAEMRGELHVDAVLLEL